MGRIAPDFVDTAMHLLEGLILAVKADAASVGRLNQTKTFAPSPSTSPEASPNLGPIQLRVVVFTLSVLRKHAIASYGLAGASIPDGYSLSPP